MKNTLAQATRARGLRADTTYQPHDELGGHECFVHAILKSFIDDATGVRFPGSTKTEFQAYVDDARAALISDSDADLAFWTGLLDVELGFFIDAARLAIPEYVLWSDAYADEMTQLEIVKPPKVPKPKKPQKVDEKTGESNWAVAQTIDKLRHGPRTVHLVDRTTRCDDATKRTAICGSPWRGIGWKWVTEPDPSLERCHRCMVRMGPQRERNIEVRRQRQRDIAS